MRRLAEHCSLVVREVAPEDVQRHQADLVEYVLVVLVILGEDDLQELAGALNVHSLHLSRLEVGLHVVVEGEVAELLECD